MKIATWNINGIKARQERVLAWLQKHEPDVLCLQEIKSQDESFPTPAFEALGYQVATYGQKSYNGVALFSRSPLRDVTRGFGDGEDDDQARFIAATAGDRDVRVMSIYVPNGSSLESDKYPYKLGWLDRLLRYLPPMLAEHRNALLAGDFNVAPTDLDVHDPAAWAGEVLCTEEERRRWRAIIELGMEDLHRRLHPDERVFTWWDYRRLGFPKNKGLRIDHLFASAPLAEQVRSCVVDRDERKGQKPSDHAPVVVEFDGA